MIIPRHFFLKYMTIKKIFKKNKNILIGMIHLPSLLLMDTPSKMKSAIQNALADLSALEQAGFDGALIENDNDKPHTEFANAFQMANLSIISHEVCKKAHIPIGVQMMLNDWKSSFAIAKSVGAKFTRQDVFVDHVTCDWGEINPDPKKILAYKNKIHPELLLLTDIQVKYKTLVKPRPLTTSARLAIQNGSDGLIITGNATGEETPLDKIKKVKHKFSDFPIFVGAGINEKNILEQFTFANGAIVGSSIKTKDRIDLQKAIRLQKMCEK